MAELLQRSTSLTSLNLFRTSSAVERGTRLADTLLGVSCREAGGVAMVVVMVLMVRMVLVVATGNDLYIDGLRPVAEALLTNTTLRSLSLHCTLGRCVCARAAGD